MEPYVGEIRMFAGDFAPEGWALCDGQLMSISENTALFDLIGTTYGGDGRETFALPDLRGRIPIHQAGNHAVGEAGGVEKVALTVEQIPAHTHTPQGSASPAAQGNPSDNVPATLRSNFYHGGPGNAAMAPQSIAPAGGGQPHTNLQPYLCLEYIIALGGRVVLKES